MKNQYGICLEKKRPEFNFDAKIMQIAILCGGLATRLRPITKKIPKSIIDIEGKPFLQYQLELLKKNGILDIVLCIGFKGEQIKKYFSNGRKFGVRIEYSEDGNKLLGTGGAIKRAESLLDEIFMVMYGDSYLPFDFQRAVDFFQNFNKLGLMTVFHNRDKYEKSNVAVADNLVKAYSKKEKTKDMEYIDYGVSIFRKEVLKYIPSDESYDLSQLHELLIGKKELLAYGSETRFYQIGSFDGLEEFKQYIKSK